MMLLDLFCGKGGWTRAAVRRGWDAVGLDWVIQPEFPGRAVQVHLPIPARLLFEKYRPDAVTASPPCEQYARHHLPWLRGPAPDLQLMQWSLELINLMPCPVIVECSKFAARHFPGSSVCGSLRLWGAVPTLLPTPAPHKMRLPGYAPGDRAVIPFEMADRFFEEIETRLVTR